MTEILKKGEKTEKRQKAEITYKIMAPSLAKLESSIDHLREFHGSENVVISPIMKNRGENGFHCFLNVLNVSNEGDSNARVVY